MTLGPASPAGPSLISDSEFPPISEEIPPEENQSTFQYEPLDKHAASIRLLVLEPMQECHNSLLSCKIIHATFQEKPSYRALSYMWGTSNKSAPILLNGHVFEVGENLHDALVEVREELNSGMLWVDAICINQKDDNERSSQVSIMDHVYSRASCVLIWLRIENVPHNMSTHWLNSAIIVEIYENEYWTRLWIIQEIGLSTNLKVIIGRYAIPWAIFIDGLRHNRHHENEGVQLGTPQQWSLIDNLDKTRKGRNGTPAQLSALLETFVRARCKEPRDKIYGLLGLAHDCQDSSIIVDYTTPLFQLYANVIAFVDSRWVSNIASLRNFDRSMRLVQFSQVLHRNLPSLKNTVTPVNLNDSLFHARGAVIGRIVHLGPTYDEWLSDPKATISWQSVFGSHFGLEEAKVLRKINEAFGVYLLGKDVEDLKAIPINPQTTLSCAFYDWFSWEDDERLWLKENFDNYPKANLINTNPCISNAAFLNTKPRLFLGSRNFIGLAPAGAQCGDELCRFWKTDIVAVLRTEDISGGPENAVHRVIGRANLSTENSVDLGPMYLPLLEPYNRYSTMMMHLSIQALSLLTY